MGFLDFAKDFLLGTEGEAQAKNEANVKQALSLVLGVPVAQISDQMIAQITGKPEEAIKEGYGQAISAVGQAGTQANLQAIAAGKAAQGQAREDLIRRGLYGSSLLTGTQQGIQNQVNQTTAGISGNTAGAQASLFAGRGQALAGETRNHENLLAQLYGNKLNALMGQAGTAANVLGNVQYQGTPGLVGPAIGAAAGAFGGGAGLALGSKLFGGNTLSPMSQTGQWWQSNPLGWMTGG